MISASDLAALQAVTQATMDVSVTVKRPALTPDGTGRQTAGTPTTVTNTVCHIAEPSAALLAQYADRVAQQKGYLVRLPAGTDVQENDQLVITGYPTLQVQGPLTPRSYAVAIRVYASVVQ